ncbi:MAG: DegT/DnrJ/EryC1/StrS family aminotransferase [Planctomycetota bacterium]|nr:DegT/DnrJ/EryC1/StrS family aminotransferase [Planctomycetota bacterium]
MEPIPFHLPDLGPDEEHALIEALRAGQLSANGTQGKAVEDKLAVLTGSAHALLVSSATHGLEMALAALDVGPGEEVLCPSFGFPSVPNAILSRGAQPLFVDIKDNTLSLNEEDATTVVSDQTAAVIPVDYGGVGCNVTALRAALPHDDIPVIQDAAHGMGATRGGSHLGTEADVGVISFHATKNITSGEGGVLLVREDKIAQRIEVMRDKGTNRSSFLRGEVPHYEWVDEGSSNGLSDLLAALLAVQLDRLEEITATRCAIVDRYREEFSDLFEKGLLIPQTVPPECQPNGHLFVIRTTDKEGCDSLRKHLADQGIPAPFHFAPLHTSRYAKDHLPPQRDLPVTERVWRTLLRLPVHTHLSDDDQSRIIDAVHRGFHE